MRTTQSQADGRVFQETFVPLAARVLECGFLSSL